MSRFLLEGKEIPKKSSIDVTDFPSLRSYSVTN
jgi:hypothetical protein